MPGRDDFPRAGYAGGDSHDLPVDLAAVQDDDSLLDLIGRAGHTPSDADDELTRVMAAWRREVHAEPFSELVDTDTALAVIHAAGRRTRRRNPVFSSVAAAAAVLVIAFSSVGLVAKSAHPGDPLWGVTQVLYRDYAHSVQMASDVKQELDQAKTALQENKPEQARAKLQLVQQQLPGIGEAEGRTKFTTQKNNLVQMLNGSPDAGAPNGPEVPRLVPSVPAGARREPGASPKPSERPTSAESTPASNSPTEPPSGTPTTPPSRIPVGPGSQGHSVPGPSGGTSGIGPTGNIGPTGGDANTGKDVPGGGTADGDTTGDGGPQTGGPQTSSSPNSDPAGSSQTSGTRPSVTAPSPPFTPGCDRVGPRPPYCG